MKTVEQLAREAKLPYYYRTGEISNLENLQCFHDLAIAQYRESLLAGVGEPDYTDSALYEPTAYTRDKVAAAVAIERERCAKVVEEFPHDQLGCLDEVAAAIRGQR